QRHHTPWPFERQICGFAKGPLPPAIIRETLLRADAIDWQLQRTRSVWRPPEFVVDQTECPVLQQVNAIGESPQRRQPWRLRRFCGRVGPGRNYELTAQPMFEKTLDDRRRPLGFHPKDGLA